MRSSISSIDGVRRQPAAVRIGGIQQHQALQQLRVIDRELRRGHPTQGMADQGEILPAELGAEFEGVGGEVRHTEIVFIRRRIRAAGTAVVDGDGSITLGRQSLLHHAPDACRGREPMDEQDALRALTLRKILDADLGKLREGHRSFFRSF
jgi:hypothetical protein